MKLELLIGESYPITIAPPLLVAVLSVKSEPEIGPSHTINIAPPSIAELKVNLELDISFDVASTYIAPPFSVALLPSKVESVKVPSPPVQ